MQIFIFEILPHILLLQNEYATIVISGARYYYIRLHKSLYSHTNWLNPPTGLVLNENVWVCYKFVKKKHTLQM